MVPTIYPPIRLRPVVGACRDAEGAKGIWPLVFGTPVKSSLNCMCLTGKKEEENKNKSKVT